MRFIIAAMMILIGCTPQLETGVEEEIINEEDIVVEESLEDTQDTVIEEEPEEPEGSDIHGGSPANVTWSECNQRVGSHPCDFSLIDQFGDTFTLYDNFATVMVIDFSTMWCSVCKNIAPDVQDFQDEYGPNGFLWVTVLIDNATGGEPTLEDIENWADTYGIETSPVLVGSRDMVDLTAQNGYPITSWPTLVVIDRDMNLAYGINGWNESVIRGWVEDTL